MSAAGNADRGGSGSDAPTAGIEGVERGLWVIIVRLGLFFVPVLQCSSPDLSVAPTSQMNSAGGCCELQGLLLLCVSVRHFVCVRAHVHVQGASGH